MARRPVILIVDDDPSIRQTLSQLVEQVRPLVGRDYIVETATSVIDVMQRNSQGPIDMLFLDYLLPGGANGGDLLDRLQDPFSRLYVVMLSGADEQQLAPSVRQWQKRMEGRYRFLKKPLGSALHIESEIRAFLRFYDDRPLPHPIASNLSKLKQPETQHARLKSIQGFIESALKVSTLSLAAHLRCREDFVPIRDKGFAQSLTLTPWMNLAKMMALAVPREEISVWSELREVVLNQRSGLLQLARALKPLRDDELGHGEVGEEERYRYYAEQHDAGLERLIDIIGTLQDCIWAVPENVEISEIPNCFDYRVRLLMGAAMPFPSLSLRSHHRLLKGKVFCMDHRRQPLSLHPMLRWAICPPCGANRLFVLDHYESTPRFLWRASCNHKFHHEEWTTEMLLFNAKLFSSQAES